MFLYFVISVSFLIFSYSKFHSFSHLSSFLFCRPSYNTMKITENSVLSLISKFYINLYYFLKHNFSQKWNRTQFRVVHDMIYCPCEGYVNVCSICYFLVPTKFFCKYFKLWFYLPQILALQAENHNFLLLVPFDIICHSPALIQR